MIGKASQTHRDGRPRHGGPVLGKGPGGALAGRRGSGIPCRRTGQESGMTLAELLVAIAVLSVLFGLLFMPLMKSFGYIHTGNVRIDVQDTARTTFEEIIREISDAWEIYDNADDPLSSSFIMVMAQGAGANANLNPSGGGTPPPLLITPGPGPDYNVTTPLHVEYMMALARGKDPYYNENEFDLRGITQPDKAPLMEDNFWRLVRLEYYPYTDPSATPTGGAGESLLTKVLGALYPTGQEGFFREPGAFEDSLFPRMRGATDFKNSQTALDRRSALQKYGLWSTLTPPDVDAAWCQYMPDQANNTGVWSMKPGLVFQSEAVRNEVLNPMLTGTVPYPTAYQAAHGHWQVVRRKPWSYPTALKADAMYFQTFKTRVTVRQARDYYVAARLTDPSGSALDTDPKNPALISYYVFRNQNNPVGYDPGDGQWNGANPAVFNMVRYQANIGTFRRGPKADPNSLSEASALWQNSNPYYDPSNPTLFPQAPDPAKPYWPEMAFLLDPRRGVLEFRVDPPVREPKDDELNEFLQPPGALAPFQAPYGNTGDGAEYVPAPVSVDPADPNARLVRTDWIIPDMRRALTLPDFDSVFIPADTMRVMVYEPLPGGGHAWQAYTRVSRDPGRREFAYDEATGHLALGDENRQYWVVSDPADANVGKPDRHVKVRAWYQIQTDKANKGDVRVTASYLTKEIWHVTLALRAYDNGTGRSQPFQLTATVRPRNLH